MHFSSPLAYICLTPSCDLCGAHHANDNMGAAMLGGPGSIFVVRTVQIVCIVFGKLFRRHLRGEHHVNDNSSVLPWRGHRQYIWCAPCKRALANTALPCRDHVCGVHHSNEIYAVHTVHLAQGPHLCGAHHLNEIYSVHTAQPRAQSMRCTSLE